MDGSFSSFSGDGPPTTEASASTARARDSLLLMARLTFTSRDARSYEVRVRNLSPGGLMAEYDGDVAIGEPLGIELRGIGLVAGRAAWAAEGRIGVALDQPIDPKKARKPVTTRAARR